LEPSARLGSLAVGGRSPVRIMAAVNVSPESFYKGSVATEPAEVRARALRAVADGADIIDIGGASTAPYLSTQVSEETETSRVVAALRACEASGGETRFSVDTVRAHVADAALREGASVVNDVSGLKHDTLMARTIREHGASLLAMAHSRTASRLRPIPRVRKALEETLEVAGRAGIDQRSIVLDPGIGFFRKDPASETASRQAVMPWFEWDCEVLANLGDLVGVGRPLGVGLSRKSFIGELLGLKSPEDRLSGSLALTALAVVNGASLVRTHDVAETLRAVRVAEAVRRRRERP
jgi:dihydropteroate synthase